MKQRIHNEELKSQFTPEKIATFFSNFLSGNEFYNNLQAAEFTTFDKAEVHSQLKVKDNFQTDLINIQKNLSSKIISLTDNNEIIFDDEAYIKLKDSPIKFKSKDIFEVIAFLKFIIKKCGQKMEKCEFDVLTKDKINSDRTQLMNKLKEKFKNMKEEFQILTNSTLKSFQNFNQSLTNSSVFSNSNKNNNLRHSDSKEIVNNLHFKEMSSETNSINSMFNVNKDIESEIELEFNNYKDNKINEYETFLNNPMIDEYASRYYYGGD